MYWCDVIQDEAITGGHQSVLSGIWGKNTKMNLKALLLLLHWDSRDRRLMRHLAPDFIAFVIHYASLTPPNETTATGRKNEHSLLSYLAKESKVR